MNNRKLPIGYWIKQVDKLLTDGIDSVQAQFGLARSDWQIIHFLSEQPSVETEKLLETMKPFMDSKVVEDILTQLCSKGLVNIINNHSLALTAKGKKQHADCLERQKEFRQTVMKDISEEDYLKTIQTLQKIVDNIKV